MSQRFIWNGVYSRLRSAIPFNPNLCLQREGVYAIFLPCYSSSSPYHPQAWIGFENYVKDPFRGVLLLPPGSISGSFARIADMDPGQYEEYGKTYYYKYESTLMRRKLAGTIDLKSITPVPSFTDLYGFK